MYSKVVPIKTLETTASPTKKKQLTQIQQQKNNKVIELRAWFFIFFKCIKTEQKRYKFKLNCEL